MLYTSEMIETMLKKVNDAPEPIKESFKAFVNENTNFSDAGHIMACVNNAYEMGYESFYRYDSDVCEQFISFYEKTFDNPEWINSFDKSEVEVLATEIDQFTFDYDTYEYKDNVSDREYNVEIIKKDLLSGNTEHFNEYLKDVISENENMVDEAKALLDKIEKFESRNEEQNLEANTHRKRKGR